MTCLSSPSEKENATGILSLLWNVRRYDAEGEAILCMLSWDINKSPPKKKKKREKDLNILDCLHTQKLTVHAFAQGTPAVQECNP